MGSLKQIEDIGFGYRPRAAYARHPAFSRGRFFPEPESRTRTSFQRDRDRIIHSAAFRRLEHKTQVFIAHEGDHYRTRLTHSIEVAQIARALARTLCCDEDLAEAVALAHDFGHTPFGHTGEDVLNDKMAPWGGFNHNDQSLRIVTKLERRYAEFDGLNLTWEVLEGLVKHNGPLTDEKGEALKGVLAHTILSYSKLWDLDLALYPSVEAQCAAIADDIAYNAHDIDDGLRAKLLTLEMLEGETLPGRILSALRRDYPDLDPVRRGHELVRRQITAMVEDVVTTARENLKQQQPASAEEVSRAGRPMVVFSREMAEAEASLKKFLRKNLYRHPQVLAVRARADNIMHQLFDCYFADPREMPGEWGEEFDGSQVHVKARGVADFLSGMTDTSAIKEHERLFGYSSNLC